MRVGRMPPVLWRQSMAAGRALAGGLRRLKPVADGDALVEYITFTAPFALVFGHFLQVFKDTALKLIDMLKPLLDQPCREFFASYAAGAECGDFSMFGIFQGVAYEFGKLFEIADARINRTFERAQMHFVAVARIQHDSIRVGDQAVPLGRSDMRAAGAGGQHRLAQRDDFFFEADFGTAKRLAVTEAFLVFELAAYNMGFKMRKERIDGLACASQRAVNTFGGY